MSEELAIILGIAGFMLLPAAIVAFVFFSKRKVDTSLEERVKELTPSQTLAEAVVAPGAAVDLRARSTQGAHKVWLDCDAHSPTGRWSATATLVCRVAPPGSGYRDGAPADGATTEGRLTFGEDGDGITTIGPVSVPRTGGLAIPRGGHTWLQLMALPACPEGSELFVRVALADLTPTEHATFRAFIGVSVA
ncbi:hypothetical protein BH11MYX4_BH11MYX4_60970 [soil metagenome]